MENPRSLLWLAINGSIKNVLEWTPLHITCDSCNKWFHKECLGMNTLVYQGLRNISWNYDICGLSNLSSHIFDTSTITSVNSNDTFTDTSFNLDSLGSPIATSSPMQKTRSNTYTKNPRSDTPLRILVVNCQVIKNKKQELENLIKTSRPDIMISTESWVRNDRNIP